MFQHLISNLTFFPAAGSFVVEINRVLPEPDNKLMLALVLPLFSYITDLTLPLYFPFLMKGSCLCLV